MPEQGMGEPAKREPNAEMRKLAASLMQMYLALTQEGFTEQQSLAIIGQAIAAAQGGQES